MVIMVYRLTLFVVQTTQKLWQRPECLMLDDEYEILLELVARQP